MAALANIRMALSGAIPVSKLSKAEKSALQLPIYNLAVKVLALPSKSSRREMLAAMAKEIKNLVEIEAKRLWVLRR